jgi:hypothetical protein
MLRNVNVSDVDLYDMCVAIDKFYTKQIEYENVVFLDAEVIRLKKLATILVNTLYGKKN